MEVAMRIVVVVFATLMRLGLLAFGVVVVQKATDPVPLMAAAAGASSPLAKSDKASPYLCEGVKAPRYTWTAVPQNNTICSVGFSSSCAGNDAICRVQQARRARALASH